MFCQKNALNPSDIKEFRKQTLEALPFKPQFGFLLGSHRFRLAKMLRSFRKYLPSDLHMIVCAAPAGLIGTNEEGVLSDFENPNSKTTLANISFANLGPGSVVDSFFVQESDVKTCNIKLDPKVNWKAVILFIAIQYSTECWDAFLIKFRKLYPSTALIGGVVSVGQKESILFRMKGLEIEPLGKGLVALAIGEDPSKSNSVRCPIVISKSQAPVSEKFQVATADFDSRDEVTSISELRSSDGRILSIDECANFDLRAYVSVVVWDGIEDSRTLELPDFLNCDIEDDMLYVHGRARVGQYIQFYRLSEEACKEQLKQDLSSLKGPLLGGLNFKCIARGRRFYKDLNAESKIFQSLHNGVPLSGIYCNAGEIVALPGPSAFRGVEGFTSNFILFE